jgi:hypothetical protein
MIKIQTFLPTIILALLAVIYHCWLQTKPVIKNMPDPEWHFEAQHGFFSHDDDPESWDFRATTLPSLGLLERSYPFNDNNQTSPHGTSTQWNRFLSYIQYLNEKDPVHKRYKLLYIVCHGQGLHNVKEHEVGREEWNLKLLFVPVVCFGTKIFSAPLGQAVR